MRLSKSSYLKGLQCLKSLWLFKHREDLIPEAPPSLQRVFDEGHRIGRLAWKRFPEGRLISEDYRDLPGAMRSTRDAARDGAHTLYEAAALHDQVLVRPDILIRRGSAWDMVEVKGSTGVADVHIEDVAIQKHILAGAGYPIRKCFVMHVDNSYVRRGEIDPRRFFTLVDVSKPIAPLQQKIPARLAAMRRALAKTRAPDIDIGPQCSKPYECAFVDHCWKHIPEYSVFDLVRIRAEKAAKMANRGILKIRDIPEDFDLTAAQQIQVQVEKSRKPYINAKAITRFLKSAVYPLYFLDFETVAPAIPPYDGLCPYQQLPFQASLHVQRSKGGPVEHYEYLGDAKADPRPGLLEHVEVSEFRVAAEFVACLN